MNPDSFALPKLIVDTTQPSQCVRLHVVRELLAVAGDKRHRVAFVE